MKGIHNNKIKSQHNKNELKLKWMNYKVATKYLGTMLTKQHCIHEENKSRLNFWNAFYHKVPQLLSSRPLPKNAKIKIWMGVKPGLSQ